MTEQDNDHLNYKLQDKMIPEEKLCIILVLMTVEIRQAMRTHRVFAKPREV